MTDGTVFGPIFDLECQMCKIIAEEYEGVCGSWDGGRADGAAHKIVNLLKERGFDEKEINRNLLND